MKIITLILLATAQYECDNGISLAACDYVDEQFIGTDDDCIVYDISATYGYAVCR